jgi:glycosyltransferase 2 family protein
MLFPLVRWSLLVVVLTGVTYRVWLEREKLACYDFRLVPGWLLVSGLFYLTGLAACLAFWQLSMRNAGAHPALINTVAAYFAGHLGKYVPGKGLVVVIRAGLVKGPGVTPVLAAFTCAVETLLMMATGSAVACLILLFVDVPHGFTLLLLSAGVAVALGALILPPVSFRLLRMVTKPFGDSTAGYLRGVSWVTLGTGTALMVVSWLLMGLSLAATLAAMQHLSTLATSLGILKTYGLLVALVALANVGGFISMIPGGLGAREWILLETLGPVIGSSQAVVAAGVIRLTWLAVELLAAGIFWTMDHQWNKRNPSPV